MGRFEKTISNDKQDEATLSNLKALLESEKGELLGDPYFGISLKRYLFDQNNKVVGKYFKIPESIILDSLFDGVWDLERNERQPISYMTTSALVYEGHTLGNGDCDYPDILIKYYFSDYGKTWLSLKEKDVAKEYYALNKATDKQKRFITEICEVLDLCEPTSLTKQQASEFISKHIEEYNKAFEDDYYSDYDSRDYPDDEFDDYERNSWGAFEQKP